jgi:hypothetical protein
VECRHKLSTRSFIFACTISTIKQGRFFHGGDETMPWPGVCDHENFLKPRDSLASLKNHSKWCSRIRAGAVSTRPAWPPRLVLPAAMAAPRKTCAGRVHIATQESAESAQWSMSHLARVPRRSVAIPGCRRSGNARKRSCVAAPHGRKTALRTHHNAMATLPQN